MNKKITKGLQTGRMFVGVLMVSAVLFYVVYYITWYIGVDIMSNRIPHHFLAGVGMIIIFSYILNVRIVHAMLLYMGVCLVWETGQTYVYARNFQLDQLAADVVGAIVSWGWMKIIRPLFYYTIFYDVIAIVWRIKIIIVVDENKS